MKIAYLITAYKDTLHLKRLINSLKTDTTKFFIHVDLKVDIDSFSDLIKESAVQFIEERYLIHWGGYSQVRSIVALMRAMINSKTRFDRVVVLSGQDYPLFSNSQIVKEFEKNPQKQYLTGYNITQGQNEGQKRKILQFHFLDPAVSKKKRLFKYAVNKLHLKRKGTIRFNGKRNDVYFGSDYWALTYDCALYVYNTLTRNRLLRFHLMFSFVPSEIFVHTIVFNSEKYKEHVEFYPAKEYHGLSTLTPLHYIEYTNQIKIFEENYYDTLLNSGKMFFRKAETGISDKLLDKIDQKRIQ